MLRALAMAELTREFLRTRFDASAELYDLARPDAEIAASGLFDPVLVRHFDWELTYDAEGYIRLLETFSDHIAWASWQRERLHAEIRRRLSLRPDGKLRRHWGAALHVARRREQ